MCRRLEKFEKIAKSLLFKISKQKYLVLIFRITTEVSNLNKYSQIFHLPLKVCCDEQHNLLDVVLLSILNLNHGNLISCSDGYTIICNNTYSLHKFQTYPEGSGYEKTPSCLRANFSLMDIYLAVGVVTTFFKLWFKLYTFFMTQ